MYSAFCGVEKGMAPLAARPARQLSIAAFAVMLVVIKLKWAKRFALAKRLQPSNPFLNLNKQKEIYLMVYLFLWRRERDYAKYKILCKFIPKKHYILYNFHLANKLLISIYYFICARMSNLSS